MTLNGTEMNSIAYIILGIIAGIIVFFSFLNWITAKSYKPRPEEVADKLRRVLDGTMTWHEWDEFVCVPMRHNDALERIRKRCVEMESKEFCTRIKQDEQEKWIYNQKGLEEVNILLKELEKGFQQSASGNLASRDSRVSHVKTEIS